MKSLVLAIAAASLLAAPAQSRPRTIVESVDIDAPMAVVWRAITTAEGWQQWAAAVAWRTGTHPLIIETSYDPAARPGDPTTIRQLFVRQRPRRSVAFRTVKAPAAFKDFETYRHVVNVIGLTPSGARRTHVRFTAGPFPRTPAGDRLYAFFKAGDRKTLDNMARVLGDADKSRFADDRRR